MLVVGLGRAAVTDLLTEHLPSNPLAPDGNVEVACENSPANTVLCGASAALEPVMALLAEQKVSYLLSAWRAPMRALY